MWDFFSLPPYPQTLDLFFPSFFEWWGGDRSPRQQPRPFPSPLASAGVTAGGAACCMMVFARALFLCRFTRQRRVRVGAMPEKQDKTRQNNQTTKQDKTKQNETKRNETKMKRNETK